jgi:hypothetical protein
MIISANKWEHDVQGYLNICNITDSTPRKQIRDFAAGVNDLGLWNSMVCWPLRSTQNAGTGTTAYSLGGLGTFNGTLVNGPIWGVDGITKSASNHHITNSTAILSTSGARTNFAVAKITSASGESNYLSSSTLSATRFALRCDNGTSYRADTFNGSGGDTLGSTTGTAGVFHSACASYDGATFRYFFNTTNTGSRNGVETFGGGSMTIGGWAPSSMSPQPFEIAFAGILNSGLTATQVTDLHNLYRNTLGTGLGLP